MKNIEIALIKNLNFSSRKAKVYLALLELGESTAVNLAHKTGLKRTTVYNILPELMQDGFITVTQKNKKRYFLVDDPRRLITETQEKVSNLEQVLPYLQNIHNVFPYKPRITFHEGLGGMKEIYNDIIKSVQSGEKILSIVGTANLDKFIPPETVKKYIDFRIKKRVVNKMICLDTVIAREWQKTANEELREIKIINNNKISFQADMKIYGNKVAFLSYRENYMGIIIESREISQLQKQAFEIMWHSIM